MSSPTTTPYAPLPTTEVILDAANLSSYLQDRLVKKSEFLTTNLSKGYIFIGAAHAQELADDAKVVADLQGDLDYAMDAQKRKAEFPRSPSCAVAAKNSLDILARRMRLVEEHFGGITV